MQTLEEVYFSSSVASHSNQDFYTRITIRVFGMMMIIMMTMNSTKMTIVLTTIATLLIA